MPGFVGTIEAILKALIEAIEHFLALAVSSEMWVFHDIGKIFTSRFIGSQINFRVLLPVNELGQHVFEKRCLAGAGASYQERMGIFSIFPFQLLIEIRWGSIG